MALDDHPPEQLQQPQPTPAGGPAPAGAASEERLETASGRRQPRIAPGTRSQLGPLNALIAEVLHRVSPTPAGNLFATLGRHRWLFRSWLPFAGGLMFRGALPRADRELVILRVAHNCASRYEWLQHASLARRAGLSAADIERIRVGGLAEHWSARQSLLLQGCDELHERRELRDGLWRRLSEHLSDKELIELCMLVGHYEMLAMTIASLAIQPERDES